MKKFYKMMEKEYGHEEEKDVVELAIGNLQQDGVLLGAAFCNLPIGARLILLAEAINWAAKVFGEWYYQLKPTLIAMAAQQWGVRTWFSREEGTWNLYHTEVGTASFHDPNCEVEIGQDMLSSWSYPWSGIRRQDLAFDMLENKELLQEMARITRPRRFPLSTTIPTSSLP